MPGATTPPEPGHIGARPPRSVGGAAGPEPTPDHPDHAHASSQRPAPEGWTAELLAGFRAGHPQALAAVYRLHVEGVVGLLRRGFVFASGGERRRFLGLASPSDLQDAVQETFRRAFEPQARLGFDGIRPYAPYLGTIARNVVLAELRRQARRFPTVTLATGGDASNDIEAIADDRDPPLGPAQWIHEAQVRGLVERFVAGLAPADQALVALRFRDGLSQRDAAIQLSMGRQVVRTREHAIRRALLSYLRERGELGLVEGATGGAIGDATDVAVVALGLHLIRLVGEALR